MRSVVLDSLGAGAISEVVGEALAGVGEVRRHDLRTARLAPCRGCFECWIEHPGECKTRDDANAVMADIVGSDRLVWVVRVRFGCWDPVAKAALDKCLGLLSPFFAARHGETHHARRYRALPPWGVVAVVDRDTPTSEREAFSRLVQRNVINFDGAEPWVAFVEEGESLDHVRAALRSGLEHMARAHPADFAELAPFVSTRRAGVPRRHAGPRRACLWVGSPKTDGTSSSEVFGRALLRRLNGAGWSTEVVHTARAVRLGRDEAPELEAVCRRADLVVLATPVYIDALPASVLAGLHALAAASWTEDEAPGFLPLVQCGFPELSHTVLATEILHRWALEVGWRWTGHLALGGGPALTHGDFEREQGPGDAQRRALSEAANELDAGTPLSEATIEQFASVPVPPAAYRLIGDAGWIARAARGGHLLELWRRPFGS